MNQLCQLMHNPSTTHWSAVKSVLRYLKGIINNGLYFGYRTLSLNAYCDLDWVGGPDDRRLTTYYGIFLGPCLVS
jgi:hypothetical protein